MWCQPMCHHRSRESVRLYEDTEEREDEEVPEWADEPDEETEDEPLAPGAAD